MGRSHVNRQQVIRGRLYQPIVRPRNGAPSKVPSGPRYHSRALGPLRVPCWPVSIFLESGSRMMVVEGTDEHMLRLGAGTFRVACCLARQATSLLPPTVTPYFAHC